MTKFTIIQGGKPREAKIVRFGKTEFLMPVATPPPDERREIIRLFKQCIRQHVEAVANSGVLPRTAVLELAASVIDDMSEEYPT